MNTNEGDSTVGAVTIEQQFSASYLMADPVVSVLMAATAAFQDIENGKAWLSSPNSGLANMAPVALLGTPEGRTRVLNEIGLIEHGMF